jgi:hypothetical protein
MASRSNLALQKAEPSYAEAMGRAGRIINILPTAATFTQLTNHANSTSPTSATLSNTAAGYATLGGRYQFALVGGAATDFALFAYAIPSTLRGFITGIHIDAMVTGAANATTATILDWSLGVNANAVSLATTDTAGVGAPRRIPLGTMAVLTSAAIGTPFTYPVDITFPTPIVCEASRYVHIILQIPVATATASEVIRGDVMINGYFG